MTTIRFKYSGSNSNSFVAADDVTVMFVDPGSKSYNIKPIAREI